MIHWEKKIHHPIMLRHCSCSEDGDKDPATLFARLMSESKLRRTMQSALQLRWRPTAGWSFLLAYSVGPGFGAIGGAGPLNIHPNAVDSLYSITRMVTPRVAGKNSSILYGSRNGPYDSRGFFRHLGDLSLSARTSARPQHCAQCATCRQGVGVQLYPLGNSLSRGRNAGRTRRRLHFVRSSFDSLEADLSHVTELSLLATGVALPQSTPNATDGPIARFSELRCSHMARTVEAGLSNARLASFHYSCQLLQRPCSYEHANLKQFLKSLLGHISLAALTKVQKPQQDITQVSILMFTAFILGLRGGSLPPATRATDDVALASNLATSVPITALCTPYTTVFTLHGGAPSFYTMAQQLNSTPALPPPVILPAECSRWTVWSVRWLPDTATLGSMSARVTAAERAYYRRFLADHPVPLRHIFHISLEEIVGTQPPPPRRAQWQAADERAKLSHHARSAPGVW